jgi:hypothetical protein
MLILNYDDVACPCANLLHGRIQWWARVGLVPLVKFEVWRHSLATGPGPLLMVDFWRRSLATGSGPEYRNSLNHVGGLGRR